jgi:hypothetical protein
MTSDAGGERIRIDRADGLDEHALAEDVLDGLARPLKELPSKFFYDDRGSALFERICELPEYYPTRTEPGPSTRRAARRRLPRGDHRQLPARLASALPARPGRPAGPRRAICCSGPTSAYPVGSVWGGS